MLLGCQNKISPFFDYKLGCDKLDSSKYAIYPRPCIVKCSHKAASPMDDDFEEAKERIRESFGKVVELSPSAYDTAWVAMVPSKVSLNYPCFPQCLDWILENQREDGSWGLNPSHPLLVKDSLSSTLACLLSLRKWRLGDKQVQRGLAFIDKHRWAVDKENQILPDGFDVIFPSMIKYAKELNLDLPLDPHLVNLMIRKREYTIERALKKELKGNTANLEYVAEGLGELCHWNDMMLHQRLNGSLFDSPATTASALIYHQHDEKCYGYLNSILELHKNWVPTIYPAKIHSCLCLVDALQNLGVDRYFITEVKTVLDEIYRLWQQKNEEIFSNAVHSAMAFRLLRMHNYEVSSEGLVGFVDQEHFFTTSSGQHMSHFAILELHQASKMAIHDGKDHILDTISSWTRSFMEQKILDKHIPDWLKKEMELALRRFHGTYDRVKNRRYIESYEVNSFKMSKVAYRFPKINNIDLLKFSVQDFNLCQAHHKEDLQQLKRWFEDCRLDRAGLSQQYIYTTYFMIAAILFEPEYSDARLAYAKNSMLLALVDDFFDEYSVSNEELLNILKLVERWNEYSTVGYHSERVEIFVSALHHTIEDLAEKAHIKQGQYVKDHLINLWIELLKCLLVEHGWSKSTKNPSIDDYLSVSCVTVGVRCVVLTAQYFLGPKSLKNVMESSEMSALCNCTSMVARLLNDVVQPKNKGKKIGTPKIISILITQSHGTTSEEEARKQIKEMLEVNSRKLLGMVLQKKGSQLPQVCKDLFWKTCKLTYLLYSHGDEFRSPEEMKNNINEVLYKPLNFHSP